MPVKTFEDLKKELWEAYPDQHIFVVPDGSGHRILAKGDDPDQMIQECTTTEQRVRGTYFYHIPPKNLIMLGSHRRGAARRA